jgi:hypothetical protein
MDFVWVYKYTLHKPNTCVHYPNNTSEGSTMSPAQLQFNEALLQAQIKAVNALSEIIAETAKTLDMDDPAAVFRRKDLSIRLRAAVTLLRTRPQQDAEAEQAHDAPKISTTAAVAATNPKAPASTNPPRPAETTHHTPVVAPANSTPHRPAPREKAA